MTDKLTAPLGEFKPREIEILGLMAEGLSNTEIAERLFVTRETIRWYNKHIYSKLGTSRRTEAIALAQDMGVIRGKATKKSETSRATSYFELPVTNGPFVGRESELNELEEIFRKSEVRLLSIVAAGGMGKSRLSLELGHLIKSQFKNGAVFIDLTGISDPDEIVILVLRTLALTVVGSEVAQEMLFNYCREKELLLIFDNFEHVLAGANLLSSLLEQAPNVKIIATSRERLNLLTETVYFLDPILEDGSALFSEVALMMHPHIELSAQDHGEIKTIVEAVGGLPLALVLAATWLDTLSISEIGKEISSSLDFLSTELQDMPGRQRSIRAVIEPTWQRLSAEEQKAFLWASVFRGGFTRQTFQQATGASLKTVQALLRRSLINHGHGRRYTLHPLIQQFAFEKLTASGMLFDARKAHLYTFLNFAKTEIDTLKGDTFLEGFKRFEAEQGNIQAALNWSFDHNQEIDAGVDLILPVIKFWLERSEILLASRFIEKAVAHRPDHAELHMRQGYCHYRMGDAPATAESLNRAIELAKESGDLLILANSYRIMVPIYYIQKKSRQEILGLIEKALEIGQSINEVNFIATCHDSMGMVLLSLGRPPDEVLEHYQKALAIYEQHGNHRNISSVKFNMALEHYRKRNVPLARELFEESLDLMRQIDDRVAIARRLTRLARWDIVDEEFDLANQNLLEAQAFNRELGQRSHLMHALYIQGVLFTITEKYVEAEATLKETLDWSERLFHNEAGYKAQSNLALLFLLQGRVEDAKSHIREGFSLIEGTAFTPWEIMTAYANFLWYDGDFERCAQIVATMARELDKAEQGEVINNKYFLRPLIYRVSERLGDEEWQATLSKGHETDLKQHFDEAIKTWEI